MADLNTERNFIIYRTGDGILAYKAGSKNLKGHAYPNGNLVIIPYQDLRKGNPEYFTIGIEREGTLNLDEPGNPAPNPKLNFLCPEKSTYLKKVEKLKKHILRGDIYEINFCIQFTAEGAVIDPFAIFYRLDAISQAPFACLVRMEHKWIICSSPERFLRKQGKHLITQPIKGTARRGKNPEEDALTRKELLNSLKEKTENVMIVDVARHDLSRIAKKGSVNVDELFGIYSFRQVHQMISTVSCELKGNVEFDDILAATFPMASMTGAPKIRAMQLISEYEDFERGFYSGSIGIIEPGGDFDLNVVIRSIVYDEEKRQASFAVGSAITALSDPEKEWEECMLKAKAMIQVLSS